MICSQPLILLKHFCKEALETTDELVEEGHTSTWHLDMAFTKDSCVPGCVTPQGYLGTALVCHTMVLWSLIQGSRSPMQQHLAGMSLLIENDTKDNHVHYEKMRTKRIGIKNSVIKMYFNAIFITLQINTLKSMENQIAKC